MRNELLGYLLGALDADERAAVETNLAGNHELQREMELLRRGLAPLEADGERIEPPAYLWRRTVEFVLLRAGQYGLAPTADAAATLPNPAWFESPRPTRKWRMVDVSVAAGILVAALSVVIPALIQTRANAERLACSNRLKDTHAGIARYAGLHNGALPMASLTDGIEGNAGIYAPMLVEAGFIDNHESVICPSSDLAREPVEIPSVAEIKAARGKQRERLLRVMGGSYAYRVGYWENGKYHRVVLRFSGKSPLMADLPYEDCKPRGHHGGCGRNVLMSDGSVDYIGTCCLPGTRDQLYVNDNGEPDAGLGRHDIVVLAGDRRVGMSPKMLPVRNGGGTIVDE